MVSKRFDLECLIGAPERASNITLLWCDYFKWHSINGIYMATSRSLTLPVALMDITSRNRKLRTSVLLPEKLQLDKTFQFLVLNLYFKSSFPF